MPYPLTLATILQRNRLLFGKKEVVSRTLNIRLFEDPFSFKDPLKA